MLDAHPKVGRFLLAVQPEPQSERAWLVGAAGERAVGAWLDSVVTVPVVALHDRRVPGSRAI